MSTPTLTPPRLSPEQVARYHAEGYLIYPEAVLPQAKFDALKAHFERKLAALPPEARPESMDVPHFTDVALFEWLFADEILDLVEPITGPDIALFSSHFICKPKGDGKRVPWHEDSAYWKTMLPTMDTLVTVWLAIDPSLPINGCMYVIPRTHREGQQGFSDYEPVDTTKNVFANEIIQPHRDQSKAVPCELTPNHASLHDSRLIHGSAANTSNLRRCGYTMRFMSSRLKLTETARAYHQIYLARGRDLAGQAYADPTQPATELLARRKAMGKKGH
jgi:ectoine hydroxylase-related dioxygenase (phytanoyl-CoA dioxygenase family)